MSFNLPESVFVRKIFSLLIDYIVLSVIFFLIINLIMPVFLGLIWGILKGLKVENLTNEVMENVLGHASVYLMLLICYFYYSLFNKSTGKTFGDRLMRLQIHPIGANTITLISSVIRTLFLAPLLAFIGFVPVAKDPYKSFLDKICSTETVKIDRKGGINRVTYGHKSQQ